MKHLILLFSLLFPILLQAQDVTTPTMQNVQLQTIEQNISSNNTSSIITNTNTTSSNIQYYSPGYKTFNYNKLKTKNIPKLLTSDGMLKNIDYSYWSLKFYSHPDRNLYNQINLAFENNSIRIQTIDLSNKIIEDNQFHLSPVKMFKPNEGIFAYANDHGELRFIYMNLLLEHLLALKMVNSYEEAEKASSESLTKLGVFTLR